MDNLNNKLKISIDLMGGDSSPDKTLEGIDLFVKRYNSKDDYFFIYLVIQILLFQKLKN